MGLTDFFEADVEQTPGPVIKETPWAPEVREWLTGLMQGEMDFPVQQVAGLSEAEQAGMGILKEIISGQAFADPAEHPAYLGFRRESMMEEDRGVSGIRRGAQVAGMGGSSRSAGVEGDYRRGMSAQRLGLLGTMLESERGRDNPYTRLSAAMGVGALPREIENARMTAEYNALMQNLVGPYTYQQPVAQSLLNYQPWYQPQFTSSPSIDRKSVV